MFHWKSIPLALIAFFALFGSDFLIHQVWLSTLYGETQTLWRTEEGMLAHFPFMVAGHILSAIALTGLWLRGGVRTDLGAVMSFGCFLGLLLAGNNLIMFAVQPVPMAIVGRWIVAGFLQVTFLGYVFYFATGWLGLRSSTSDRR